MERAARDLTSRSVTMTGLRGVGKTVLLNEFAHARAARRVAHREGGGGQGRRPLPGAGRAIVVPSAARGHGLLGRRGADPPSLATFKSFSLRTNPRRPSRRDRDRPRRGRADTGSLEVDLTDLALDLGGAAAESARRGGVRRRDAGPRRRRARRDLPGVPRGRSAATRSSTSSGRPAVAPRGRSPSRVVRRAALRVRTIGALDRGAQRRPRCSCRLERVCGGTRMPPIS